MKNLTASVLLTVALGLAGCSSTSSGPANYSDADRGPSHTTTTETETTVSTPEAAPIPTKSGAGNDVLDHNAGDQQLAHP